MTRPHLERIAGHALILTLAIGSGCGEEEVRKDVPAVQKYDAKLDTTPMNMDFTDASLTDVVDFIRDYLQENIHLSADVDAALLDRKISFKVRDLPARKTLNLLLAQFGLTWRCGDPGGIYITNAKKDLNEKPETSIKPEPWNEWDDPAVKAIRGKLAAVHLDLDFTDTALADILDFIRDSARINIYPDSGMDPRCWNGRFRSGRRTSNSQRPSTSCSCRRGWLIPYAMESCSSPPPSI